MKKIIILSAFVFLPIAAFAQEAALFEGFPVYPPQPVSAQIMDDVAKFNLNLLYPELRERFESNQEAFFREAHRQIQKANEYLLDKAQEFGWMQIARSGYSDGGSDLLVFAKKTPDKIITVEASIWHGFAFAGKPLSDKWGTAGYEFTEFPLPLTYKDFPLVPGIDKTDAYEKTTDESGNEVLKTEMKDTLGPEKYRLLYSALDVYKIRERLYGWEKYEVKYDVMNKLGMRGDYTFFIKDNQLVRTGSTYSKNFQAVFYTPQEQERIMRIVDEESQKKPKELTPAEKQLMQMRAEKERQEKRKAFERSQQEKTQK